MHSFHSLLIEGIAMVHCEFGFSLLFDLKFQLKRAVSDDEVTANLENLPSCNGKLC